MNQVAFVILFLYIRSFELPKYPKDFDDRKRESKPDDDEFRIDKLKRRQQEKVLENQRRVENNYSLERRKFL